MYGYRHRRRRTFSLIDPATKVGTAAWRRKTIHDLCKAGDVDKFVSTIFSDQTSSFIENMYRLQEIHYYVCQPFQEAQAFKEAFSNRVCFLMERDTVAKFKTSWGYTRAHNPDIIKIIKHTANVITPEARNKIVDALITNGGNFNPTAKKMLAGLITTWLSGNDSRNIDTLRKYIRNLETKDMV